MVVVDVMICDCGVSNISGTDCMVVVLMLTNGYTHRTSNAILWSAMP